MPDLISFSAAATPPQYDHPRPDRLVRGNPLRTTREHYLSAHGDFSCGLWACEPGAWRIVFPPEREEFFHVIEGRVRIADEAGRAMEFGPGEACVIPGGFTGTFEVLEAVKKHYVFIDRAVTLTRVPTPVSNPVPTK